MNRVIKRLKCICFYLCALFLGLARLTMLDKKFRNQHFEIFNFSSAEFTQKVVKILIHKLVVKNDQI